MQISKQSDYAIRTILELGRNYPKIISAKEIASKQAIPQPFLNKTIQILHKSGLVETIRGAHGGVRLRMAPDQINLKDVIESVDGPISVNRCLVAPEICSNQSRCVAHGALYKARRDFIKELEVNTIADLLNYEKEGWINQ
ncbi:MAG: Rrf2 family transcriptional regulator [Heliobacteriaceae bacterium]|nr:Rrf2 family transcriptional regulator [Heliobacteriaceae bacterium]MDD4588692.1 Rrf2 family transcriptional regulator [Heliobacteriaceae bacterium]